MTPPTLNARDRVAAHVPPSPLMRHPPLDSETGLQIWVKPETLREG